MPGAPPITCRVASASEPLAVCQNLCWLPPQNPPRLPAKCCASVPPLIHSIAFDRMQGGQNCKSCLNFLSFHPSHLSDCQTVQKCKLDLQDCTLGLHSSQQAREHGRRATEIGAEATKIVRRRAKGKSKGQLQLALNGGGSHEMRVPAARLGRQAAGGVRPAAAGGRPKECHLPNSTCVHLL